MGDAAQMVWRWARFRFLLRFRDEAILPPYKGAVFRGVFGKGLRRLVCLAPQVVCGECAFASTCLYTALFEPSPPPGAVDAGKYRQAPRPFVLNPPLTSRQAFHAGDTVDFDLVLIGPAMEALPYFIYIFQEIGKKGLGRERSRYELVRVEQDGPGTGGKTDRGPETGDRGRGSTRKPGGDPVIIFERETIYANLIRVETGPVALPGDAAVQEVTLELLTPLRLKVKGDLATALSFPLLWENLSRRLALLAAFYGDAGEPDFTGLAEKAAGIETRASQLHWYDWSRYSYSQKERLQLGGLKGTITFAGELGPFLPYLRLGEQVNVGQGTTFGLGRFKAGLS